jgi:hypothetical protein
MRLSVGPSAAATTEGVPTGVLGGLSVLDSFKAGGVRPWDVVLGSDVSGSEKRIDE